LDIYFCPFFETPMAFEQNFLPFLAFGILSDFEHFLIKNIEGVRKFCFFMQGVVTEKKALRKICFFTKKHQKKNMKELQIIFISFRTI